MSISVPLSLPVKISAQDSNLTFTQNDQGYFMNLDLKVEVPIKELVDSLMKCGDQVKEELAFLTAPGLPQNPGANAPSFEAQKSLVSRLKQASASESESTACDNTSPEPAAYCSIPFPRIDSPYRTRAKWSTESATYFLREHRVSTPPPEPIKMNKRQLSPNAPVFTPLSHRFPTSSPFTQCSLAGSEGVWDLPGLPSPLVESNPEPIISSTDPPAMGQSILQRGLSNQCRQM